MRSHDLACDLRLVRPRVPQAVYHMDHAHGRFYVLTSSPGSEREVRGQSSECTFKTIFIIADDC